jgi:hypothetical protein
MSMSKRVRCEEKGKELVLRAGLRKTARRRGVGPVGIVGLFSCDERALKAGRRINRNAKLKTLGLEEQARIYGYSKGKFLTEVAAWLGKQGIKVTPQTVSNFLGWYEGNLKTEWAAGKVEALLEAERRRNPKASARRLQEMGQAHFTELMMAEDNVRGWYLTQQIALRQGQLDLERKKLREQSAERKARLQAELNPSAPTPGGLTDEAIKEITEKLNLM